MRADMIPALAIFALTYVLISGRKLNLIRIGRPAGVMLGTVLMIMAKVIRPEQVPALVNWDTILLLLGMMIIIEHLAEAEFFALVSRRVEMQNFSVYGLLALVVFGLGFLAAFLVNDIVCIFFTPLLLIMIHSRKLPPLPFLLALATSTNIGGAMAFTGNPQNMIIGSLSGISYARFFWLMLPIGVIGLTINYLLLLWMFKRELREARDAIVTSKDVTAKPLLKRSLSVTLAVVVGFFLFKNIAWVALTGATLLMLFSNRDESSLLRRVDWNLLLFFAGLFVVIGGLQASGVTGLVLQRTQKLLGGGAASFWGFGLLTIVGSNLFANVPYVLVAAESISKLVNPVPMWYALAFGSTIAGNLTILGAVANVIVVERARGTCDISFRDFFRFGLPSTLAIFTVGMAILWVYTALGWI